jgi:hypothetical protein
MTLENKIMFAFAALIILLYIPSILYFTLGWFKRFYHDALGWHTPDYTLGIHDNGFGRHAKCKHCGKEILQDSQGNWFTCK